MLAKLARLVFDKLNVEVLSRMAPFTLCFCVLAFVSSCQTTSRLPPYTAKGPSPDQASGNASQIPGEYEFPAYLRSSGGRAPITIRTGYAVNISADYFESVAPRDVLLRISAASLHTELYGTSWFHKNASYGVFYVEKYRYVGGFPSPYSNPSYGNVFGGDSKAERLLDSLRDVLFDGIDNGKWVEDPILSGIVPSDSQLPTAALCTLTLDLVPTRATPAPDWQASPDNQYMTGLLYVGVYYWDVGEDGTDVSPSVFLFGNQTGSHIYEFTSEDSVRFHDSCVSLYRRLDELAK